MSTLIAPIEPEAAPASVKPSARRPLALRSFCFSAVTTELSRSMGQPDFYLFALPRLAVAKLHFIHTVIQSAGAADQAIQLQPAGEEKP